MSNFKTSLMSTAISLTVLFSYIYTKNLFFWLIICLSTTLGVEHVFYMIFYKKEIQKRMDKINSMIKEQEERHKNEWKQINDLWEANKRKKE